MIENRGKRSFVVTCNHGGRSRKIEKRRREWEEEMKSWEELGLKKGLKRYQTKPNVLLRPLSGFFFYSWIHGPLFSSGLGYVHCIASNRKNYNYTGSGRVGSGLGLCTNYPFLDETTLSRLLNFKKLTLLNLVFGPKDLERSLLSKRPHRLWILLKWIKCNLRLFVANRIDT